MPFGERPTVLCQDVYDFRVYLPKKLVFSVTLLSAFSVRKTFSQYLIGPQSSSLMSPLKENLILSYSRSLSFYLETRAFLKSSWRICQHQATTKWSHHCLGSFTWFTAGVSKIYLEFPLLFFYAWCVLMIVFKNMLILLILLSVLFLACFHWLMFLLWGLGSYLLLICMTCNLLLDQRRALKLLGAEFASSDVVLCPGNKAPWYTFDLFFKILNGKLC